MTFGNRKFVGFLGAATVVILAEYILILSDSIISGHVLGETALGAMNLLMPVFSFISFFTWILAVGTSIIYSDAMARQDTERAAKIAGQGLLVSVFGGLALVAVTYFLEDPYLRFMSPSEAVTTFSGAYWDWYPYVVILESVDMLLLYLNYTSGGAAACTISYVLQVAVNVGASYALCAGLGPLPKLGMAGISLGTLLAYVVGIAALLPHTLSRRTGGLRFTRAFMPRELMRSYRAAFGDASAGLFHALLFFLITKYVIYYYGSEVLPITAVVFCIVRLSVFFNGVGIALQPLETVYYGEGNETGVKRLVRFAAMVSFFEGLALSVFLFVFPNILSRMVGIVDPDLVRDAAHAARITVLGLSGYAIAYMLNSHYQYVNSPGRSVCVTAFAFFVMPAALLFLLAHWIGTDGVWLAVALGPACTVVTMLPVLRRPAFDRNLPSMFNLRLGDYVQSVAIVRAVSRDCQKAGVVRERTERLTDLLVLSLKHLRQRSTHHRVLVEITLDLRGDRARLIIRDDGEPISLAHLGPEVKHSPVAGFNRNILEVG